ncbi:hypothetical protein V5G24_23210 [Xanthobacter sp. VTT E-85241]|uniref:hypothetical protein n=1 Tax=Roseixanthobacter finlandensis TaxID=3119922 RepID=UPI0037275E94
MNPAGENPWMQTASGRAFDLVAPTAAMVDLGHDVPGALARISRFGGHVPSGSYSVAQHCVLGVDAILAAGAADGWHVAQAFLLHDAHEAYIGDITTPMQDALAQVAAQIAPDAADAAPLMRTVIREMKRRCDGAIHEAAGLPWPLPKHIHAQVKAWDLAMLATERLHLMPRAPRPWDPVVEAAQPVRLRGRIQIWPWPRAADEWSMRLRTLFPHAAARASA